MKLYYSPTSPYVRKVRVVSIELGLEDKIELLTTNPWDPATALGNFNPLGKVPALMISENEVLFDSPVICEYLDSLHNTNKLFPENASARWQALRLQALADGVLDAVVLMRLESLRPIALQSEDWRERQLEAVRRSLDYAELKSAELEGEVTIGTISLACALAYLDFRLAEEDWRNDHPQLASWFVNWQSRASMQETKPPPA